MRVNFKKCYSNNVWHGYFVSFCFTCPVLCSILRRNYDKLSDKHEFLVAADNYLALIDDVGNNNRELKIK